MKPDDPHGGDHPPRDPAREAASRVELRALDEADRMWAALEGDLDDEELARFEDRVARDAALRRRVREGRALDGLLPLYAAPQVRPDFARRALARLEAEGLLRPAWYARRISLPLPLAAALLLGAGLFTAWFFSSRAAEAPPAGPELALEAPRSEPEAAPASDDRPARRSFGPRIVIGAAGSAAALFDLEAEDELFPLDEAAAPEAGAPSTGAPSIDAPSPVAPPAGASKGEERDR